MFSLKVFWIRVCSIHCMSSACNFHKNIMIFFLGNMWIQIIKHFNWQLFTITDKGILGPGNNQIAKTFRSFAPGPHMGGANNTPHNPQLQSHIFCYAGDAPKCPKLTVMEACPLFLDYPLIHKSDVFLYFHNQKH